jgi:deoxyribose-phosphate aldolase
VANPTFTDIASMIDHSLLQPVLTDAEMEQGCKVALDLRVASVCIKPHAVRLASRVLSGSGVKVGTTVGFPHGGHATAIKVDEARRALDDGATELDMVVNIGKVLGRDWPYVAEDIHAVVHIAHSRQALAKVIFECCYLADEHKEQLCRLCTELGADFVKTSTGFGSGGAINEDVALLRRYAGPKVGVKAAGGIRTLDRLLEVRALGATRVGATATQIIFDEFRRRFPEAAG